MSHRLAGLLAALVAVVGAGWLAPAPAPALVVGIGDQKPDMFADPLFRDLGIRHARLAVAWDALTVDWQREELDAWLDAARLAGVEPLVGFGHARGADRRVLPSPSRLKYEFRRFRERYPWVRTFATWNEANHCGEPTCHRPQLVGAYYKALRRECPSCTILAAEVLDMPNMVSWIRAFERYLGRPAPIWGLHNYVDANRLQTSRTRALLAATRGKVWFTETGGIVRRRNRAKVTFPESAAHARLATRWVFQRLVPMSSRITRVYVYHWNNVASPQNWDSALVSARGRPRPALQVVRDALRAAEVRRARRARDLIMPPSSPSGLPATG